MSNQKRGHCQVCGRIQAVPSNRMAKHGYTVDHGYFSGTCAGSDRAPIEIERAFADEVMSDIVIDCMKIEAKALMIESGEIEPGPKLVDDGIDPNARRYGTRKYREVPYADLSAYDKGAHVKSVVWGLRCRAGQGRDHVEYMNPLINANHGKPLMEVAKPAAVARVQAGEKKIGYAEGAIFTARYQDKARVYYNSNSGRQGWIGTQAWRKLENLPA